MKFNFAFSLPLSSAEIPRVVNLMMTQNEAPDPPNEDPTYERYQSSEQRGKQFNHLKVIVSINSILSCCAI
jgi:hypothetical protein